MEESADDHKPGMATRPGVTGVEKVVEQASEMQM